MGVENNGVDNIGVGNENENQNVNDRSVKCEKQRQDMEPIDISPLGAKFERKFRQQYEGIRRATMTGLGDGGCSNQEIDSSWNR